MVFRSVKLLLLNNINNDDKNTDFSSIIHLKYSLDMQIIINLKTHHKAQCYLFVNFIEIYIATVLIAFLTFASY